MPVGVLLVPVILNLLGQAAASDEPPAPARIGRYIKEPRKLKHVAPKYPDDARRAGLAQLVVLECVVDPRGDVSNVDVLKGVPPLTDAAVKAVKQWRYEPTLLDGRPVPVTMTVTVKFWLSQLRWDDLVESLGSGNEHIREAAARSLAMLPASRKIDKRGVAKAVRALEPLALSDASAGVREAAARALTRLDGRPLPAWVNAPVPARVGTARPAAWGVFFDPLGQSRVAADDARIRIDIPAREVDSSIEQGQELAPRLMKPVVGDFEAELRVGELPEPGLNEGRGFHSAGLLLRQDDQNLVRLESAVVRQRDSIRGAPESLRYVLFEVRRDGKPVEGPAPMAVTLKHAPTDLRLERRGSELLALVSQGGEKWREVARVEAALPDAMQIGVTAVNTAGTQLAATLEGFAVTPADDQVAERPILPPPLLDSAAARPAADAQPAAAPRPEWVLGSGAGMDRPPEPISMPRPKYPASALRNGIEGTVLLEILIDSDGSVARSRVIQSVPGLDAAALECAKEWRFQPALKDGEPVATIAQAPVVFRIWGRKN